MSKSKFVEFRTRLKRIFKRGEQLNTKINELSNEDAYKKYAHVLSKFANEKADIKDWRRYTRQQVSDITGVKVDDIISAEKEGKLELPTMKNVNDEVQYAKYDINNIWQIREHFDAFPETDKIKIVNFGSLKGGSTKSTTTLHFAQYLALKGYKVLIVDSDPQATLTEYNGVSADLHLSVKDTIVPFIRNEKDKQDYDSKYDSLKYAIRHTQWPNISLLPATLDNDGLSTVIPFRIAEKRMKGDLSDTYFIKKLRNGLQSLSDDFDYVLIDGTPSLNAATTMYLLASDFVFTPIPARGPDYRSTLRFYEKLESEVAKLSANNANIPLPNLCAFITRFGQENAHKVLSSLVRNALKDDVKLFANAIDTYSAVDDAFSQNFSIYEIKPTRAKSAALKKAVSGYNKVFDEMHAYIQSVSIETPIDELAELLDGEL